MDFSLESKSLPSVGNSSKSYLQVTFQRLARGKLVHLNGRRSFALPSVGPDFSLAFPPCIHDLLMAKDHKASKLRDLNKVNPKDDFPLPHIDMLVDSTAGHSMLSFMDGFSRVMPFGLKNAGATYQSVATTLFHDMMHKDVECLLHPGCPLLLYLSILDMALGCNVSSARRLREGANHLLLSKRMLEYECKYIMIERLFLALVWATKRLRHYMTEYSIRLVSRLDPLRYLFDKPIMTVGVWHWHPIDITLGDHIPRSIRLAFSNHHWLTNNVVEYEACIIVLETALDLGGRESITDALATLASMIKIPVGMTMRPLLIETKFAPAYSTAKDRRALRQLSTRFVICGDALYRRSSDGVLLLCIDRATVNRVMREVHAGVCKPHMGGHMLACKIMRAGYFWLTMETDCYQFEGFFEILCGHEYILIAIDYFTKWVEATSYASLIVAKRPILDNLLDFYPLVISYELFEGEVFNSKFCINPLEPISMAIESCPAIEIEVGSLRVALEHQITETDWLRARYNQLNLLDEKRLRVVDHMHAYQRKMARAFRKRVKPRKFKKGDLVLKVLKGLISDPRGKFRPSWNRPYLIRELTQEGAAWLTDLD
ncbi:hypothetical protein CK203_101794 [Vitis vinifera]|uniref:Reverse transcriptase RNase H-like domain-containing protein n=1 Tax=Vitis vinifera TaxID=29760 RepID=A0A438FFU5_VITVI|nr:hypothetical protein CK203_101794 [Vitis vinifera]